MEMDETLINKYWHHPMEDTDVKEYPEVKKAAEISVFLGL